MIRIFFMVSASVGLMSSLAFAHPPQFVRISVVGYEISAVVTHVVPTGVSDMSKHYLNKVEFYVNGNKVHEEEYTRQVSNSFLVTFKYNDLKRGDVIKVKASCSEYGYLEKEYLVDQDPAKQAASVQQAAPVQQQNNPQQGVQSGSPQSSGPLTEVQTEKAGSMNELGESAEAQAYFQDSGSKEPAVNDK